MKLSIKLPLAFTAISLLVAGAGCLGIYRLNESVVTYESIIRVDYGNEQAVASMLVEFKTQVTEWKNTLLRGKDPKQLDKYWTAFQKHESDVAGTAKMLQGALPAGDAQRLVSQFLEAHAKMGQDYRRGFEAFKAADFESSVGDGAVKGMDRAPADLLRQAREAIVTGTKVNFARAESSSRQATITSLVLMLIGFLGSIVGGMFVARSVTHPLLGAVVLAKGIAGGDLTGSIPAHSNDEIGHLLEALHAMRLRLQSIVGHVRTGTDTFLISSREIASGNLDLSSRSEQQAASLEETASSMRQLITTVKHSADNAQQANRLAVSASGIAAKGGAVVAQVMSRMSSINQSAKKITDIIGVIDAIAFQTNILALNAAVEAARAGEQGRGFAVVASEVRNLAQRSAAAAKEIKVLITDSESQVTAGAALVSEAGTTMDEIVSSVRHVTDIMSEILAASLEQRAGIEQVNQAIGQMDQVTQQNAALVEQASTAAEALQDQAHDLANVVSIFKIGTTAAIGSSMLALDYDR